MMEGTLVPGFMVEEYKYISSKHHRMIGVGSTGKRWSAYAIENIGKRGENLTIAVLSMNRSSLTIRLMQSIAKIIPDFSGEFLIGQPRPKKPPCAKRCRRCHTGAGWWNLIVIMALPAGEIACFVKWPPSGSSLWITIYTFFKIPWKKYPLILLN